MGWGEGQSNTEDTLLESLSINPAIEEVGRVICKSEHEKCSDGSCIPSGWWSPGGKTGTRTAPTAATSPIARRQLLNDDSNVMRITTGGATTETARQRRFCVTGGPTARTAATKMWSVLRRSTRARALSKSG